MTTHTFPLAPLDGRINLSARLGHGSLTVRCVDDLTDATVEVTGGPDSAQFLEQVVVELRGPTLVVRTPRQGGVFDLFTDRSRSAAAVDVVATVPSGTAVQAATFTADITIGGRCGGADIATGVADVSLDTVDGDLRLRSGTGSSTVGRVSGSVKARTGAGGVRVAAVTGDTDLASGSGALDVGLPAGVTARLDLQTGFGRATSDLPVGDKPADPAGSTITIRARTGGGDIHVFRAGGPATVTAA